jgi:hypothetical protein
MTPEQYESLRRRLVNILDCHEDRVNSYDVLVRKRRRDLPPLPRQRETLDRYQREADFARNQLALLDTDWKSKTLTDLELELNL